MSDSQILSANALPASTPPSGMGTSQRDPVTILMVDDQPAKLMSYEIILADLGERLIKATSGREALNQLLKWDVAVVLMDVSMPEMDGFELTDMMRQHPRFQKTPVIFVSGVHLTDLDRIRGYQSGAVDYISVPVIPEVLRAKVSVFAELYRKRRELQTLNRDLEERVAQRSEELRVLNEQLQQSVVELRERAELLDLATEAIMVRDAAGRIMFWNAGAEELYGWTREEALGRNLHRLLQTKLEKGIGTIDAALETEGRWEGTLRHVSKTGREFMVASRHARQKDGSAILEINRDITGQLLAEEALRRNERLAAMGKLAGIVAHEINNPLEAITNTFYLLSTHPSLDDEARRYAGLADKELARISHITKQTLSFYRESQKAISVEIAELMDNVLELQERAMHASGVALERRYITKGAVHGFPSEIKQVFMNLISNAIQAIAGQGRIRITIRETSSGPGGTPYVSVFITDTGSGIDPEHGKRLFEPFFTTKSIKGTGLGLWISLGIVRRHEGVLRFRSLRSKALSRTCFRVSIPTSLLRS